MRLGESFLEELRARTPLAALIGRRVKLSRSGRHWKGCCPFHGEKTPSFYVYEDAYHCFGCGAHGDAIGFVMQSQGAGFMEAVELLAAEAGLDIPKASAAEAAAERRRLDAHDMLQAASAWYQANLRTPSGAAGLAYLQRRGLTDDTIARFGLGWSGEGRGGLLQALAPQDVTAERLAETGLLRRDEDGAPRGELFYNRVMFPIRDRRGRVISFGGRMLGDGQPKYVNGPETAVFSKRRTLYGLDFARDGVRAGGILLVVEGYMDVIALHQAGFSGAVAPLGTALTEEQLESLWQVSPAPVLCFDGDAAGARAAARAAEVALPALTPERTIRIATLPAGEDPDTLILRQGRAAFEAVLHAARPIGEALFDLLREGTAIATPEQRAAFRARLQGAAAKIADKGLAAEYRRDLQDRFYAATRAAPRPFTKSTSGSQRGRYGEAPPPARLRNPRPVPDGAAAGAERMRTLVAILLRNPGLLPALEEAFAALTLPPPAARLRQAMQSYLDSAESLDFQSLIDHLTTLRLTDDVAWAIGEQPFPLPACAGPDATAAEAEAGWWQVYGFVRRFSLETELMAARQAFAADPSPAAQQRLIALSAAAEAARRGEFGQEAED